MDTEKLIGLVRNNDIAKEVNQDGIYYFFINYFIFAHYLLLKIHSKISMKNWQNT